MVTSSRVPMRCVTLHDALQAQLAAHFDRSSRDPGTYKASSSLSSAPWAPNLRSTLETERAGLGDVG